MVVLVVGLALKVMQGNTQTSITTFDYTLIYVHIQASLLLCGNALHHWSPSLG